MKRKISYYFVLIISILLISCSNTKKDSDYRRVGQIKIENKYDSFEQNVEHGAEIKELDKFKTFIKETEKGKKKSISLMYIDKDGKVVRDKLMFENNWYKFFNSYLGYKVREGRYKCKKIKVAHQVTLEDCKGRNNSVFLFPLTEKDYEKIK